MLAPSGEDGRRVVYLGSKGMLGKEQIFHYFNLCFLSHTSEKKINEKYLVEFILSMQPNVMILIFCKDKKKMSRGEGGGKEQDQLW